MMARRAGVVLALAALSPAARAFYLPGAAPHEYQAGDSVPLLVNALTPMMSRNAQLNSIVSFDFYNPQFHFCQPEGGPVSQRESIGSILFGDRLYNSAFDIQMLRDVSCQSLCVSDIGPDDSKFVNQVIKDAYAFNWLVDGLPAAEMRKDPHSGAIWYSIGFQVGSTDTGAAAIHNHYQIYIDYHERDGKYRVVGAVVWPTSVNSHRPGQATPACDDNRALHLSEVAGSTTVQYSYSVTWRESRTPWATRWDNYLHIQDPKIHWLSLANSVIIATFLAIMVGLILMRSVNHDIGRFNAIDLAEDVQEDYGWKLVHGEVFRAPERVMLLSVIIGQGAQLAAMASVTLVFALFGFLSPANRGSLSTAMLMIWIFFSTIGGFVSMRIYLTFDGSQWKQTALLSVILFPTGLFATLLLLNVFLVASGSSGAVPFGTFMAIIAIWMLISAPLSLVGTWFALKRGPVDVPVRVNQIPRQIPPPSTWYLRPWPSALLGGILPFGAAFIELYFLLSSLFGSRLFAAIGFLFLAFAVVALTTATTTVLLCYFSLSQEDYRWAWRSFFTGGSCGIWLLFYGLLFGASRLSLGSFASKALYLGYLLLISGGTMLTFGAIGFISTGVFLRRIYSRIRID